MKTKILLCFLVLILRMGFADDVSSPQDLEHLQVITLDDGTKFTFLGVTMGRRQMAPHYENLATANWVYSRSNTTMVWIKTEHDPKKWPNYELLVSDQQNTACVNIEKRTGSHVKAGVDIQGFVLNAFPRRDKETILRIQPFGGSPSKGHFVMTNPVFHAVAPWTPKPLPNTESNGDLTVTLTKLVAGVPMPYLQGEEKVATNDPANQCVWLDFDFRENGHPTTNWYPWPVRTSDATGNHVRGLIRYYPMNGIYPNYHHRAHPSFPPKTDGYFYHPGLWPDESPWKVRLEFRRKAGFSDVQIITFTNLPVRAGTQQDFDEEWTWNPTKTNFNFVAEGKVNGVRMKILPPLQYPASVLNGQKHLGVIIETDPSPRRQEMNLTILQVTDGQGHEIRHPFSPDWAGHFSLDFPDPGKVKTLNLRLALHRSQFFEFVVKPMKP